MILCPKCGFEQTPQQEECLRCGVIFRKFVQRDGAPDAPLEMDEAPELDFAAIFQQLVLHIPDAVHPVAWGARVFFFLVLLIWGARFILTPLETNYAGESLWHLVNLPFHEAGHIFFRPFGSLITSLGGSLGQLLMPLICLGTFLIKTRDPFAASFALWWVGQNFIDMAPYINDARALILPLLGGNIGQNSPYGFHDWEFILKETGLIAHDQAIAHGSHYLGGAVIILSWIWGAYLLWRQFERLEAV